MGENSGIAWTHDTFNPWFGCVKVSPGCESCYAEQLVTNRFRLKVWGPAKTTDRKRSSASTWKNPLAWNRKAEREGMRRRVFCGSLADVFEDHPQVTEWRKELFALIEQTPHLDWQLLTKRPDNFLRFLPPKWIESPRRNVWLGTTVEDQKRAQERIPLLLGTPATVRFLSCEPLLERISFGDLLRQKAVLWPDGVTRISGIHWVIVGGESGSGARRFEVGWARSIALQCKAFNVACFVKQMGSFVVDRNDVGFEAELQTPPEPEAWPTPVEVIEDINGYRDDYQGADVRVRLRDRSGADPAEWPEDLRVQEFPEANNG